jgi:hypothetical protein
MKHENLIAALAAFNAKPDDSGVSIPVACAILDRSRASIWRDIAAGRLEAFSIGRSRKIKVGSLRRACTGAPT